MNPRKLSENFGVFQHQYAEMLDQAYIDGDVSRLMYLVLLYKKYAQQLHQELMVMDNQMAELTKSMNVYAQHQKRANREGDAPHEEDATQSYDDYLAFFL